jgi:hypothetical protein
VVSAGALLSPARNVLTITGNGFGNNPVSGNRIVFKDANTANTAPDFVVDFNSGYVLSWSNTEIKVRVPGRAGNGRFGVVLSPGDTAFAPNPLVVDIAVLNADFGATYGQREVRLTNRNGQGGYDFVYSTGTNGGGADFTSSASYNPFRRALSTWRETTGLNFREAGTTALQTVTGDGINIVMLDNTVTGVPVLGSGVLAITYSQFSLCEQPANATAQKSGFDIVVRNPGVSGGTTTFENGPCPPPFTNPGNIDMETVIFHELGHALNLAHVNEPLELPAAPNAFANWSNPAGAMHYAISTFSARRSPDGSSLSGALYAITPLPGLTYGTCLGQGAMTPQTASRPANDECASISFPTAATPDGTNFFVDLRNATANKGGDPAYNRVVCTNPGTAVTNNVYFAMRTAGTANFMNVAGYATLPLEVATTCASGLQGVRVSFYETNSCPAGQAFPAPAACITITANGNYTFTGLKANTTYLLFAEGVRNTKASFAMALNGTAVAPLLMTLSGNRQTDGTNRLEAIISGSANVTQVQVERSTDSVNFSAIGQLIKTGASFDGSQFFTDGSPAAGTNHYRLRSTASGGAVQFSNIVTIRPNSLRTDLAVYPNPFNGSLFISTGNTTGTMWVTLHDITGRLLLARGYNTNGQPALINLSTAHLIRGMYIVTLRNSSNEVILVKKLFHQ